MTTPSKAEPTPALLTVDHVRLGVAAAGRYDAIDLAGNLLVTLGAVEEPYIAAMHEREASMSSYMGRGSRCRMGPTRAAGTSAVPS